MSNIGQNIKNRRIELGLTADQLAERLNKSRATIYRYESTDADNMPIGILEPLSKALSTTPAELMGWNDGAVKVTTNITFDDNSPMHALTQAYIRRPALVQDEIINRLEGLDVTFSKKVSKLLQASGDINGFMQGTGLPFATVGKFMQGETVLTTPTEAERIATYFHANVVDLFFDSAEIESAKTVSKTESQLPEHIANLFKRELDENKDLSPEVRLLIEALEEYLKEEEKEPHYKDVEAAINTVKYSNFDITFREALKEYNDDLNPKVVAMIAAKELYKSPMMFEIIYINNVSPVKNLITLIDNALKLSRK